MFPLSSTVGLTWAQRLNAENRLNNSVVSTVTSVSMADNMQKTIEVSEFAENLMPIVLTADDLDPTNTRLFVKSLSPELHDYSFLYRLFRYFGRIRMLALNTKRHNAIVEYETKVRKPVFRLLRGQRRKIVQLPYFRDAEKKSSRYQAEEPKKASKKKNQKKKNHEETETNFPAPKLT